VETLYLQVFLRIGDTTIVLSPNNLTLQAATRGSASRATDKEMISLAVIPHQ